MNITKFKTFTAERYGLRLDFRSHVFLDNQYGAYPQYSFSVAETIVDSLFAFWDERGVDWSGRYNIAMRLNKLRVNPLKQQVSTWVESEGSS